MEILAEVGMAAVFALSFCFWPEQKAILDGDILEIMRLVIYFALITTLCVCFLYDAKWKELITKCSKVLGIKRTTEASLHFQIAITT
jgi:hypothetical protein